MLKLFFGKYFSKLTVWWALLGTALSLLTNFLPQIATFVAQFTPAQTLLFASIGTALARARGVYNEVAAVLGTDTLKEPQ